MGELPHVQTSLPGPKSSKIIEASRRHESSALKSFKDPASIVYDEARGAIVSDADGNTFLDMAGSYAAVVVGHNHPDVVDAVKKQLEKAWHVPSDFPTEARARYAEQLVEILPEGLNKVLFTLTGSDANDLAVMLARSYKDSSSIVSFWGGYHGRGAVGTTIGSSPAGQRNDPGTHLQPYMVPYPYCYRCPLKLSHPDCGLACLDFLQEALETPMTGLDKPAAVMIEPVQGHAGSVPTPPGFLARLRELCDDNDVLMISDEVQCGFGRTGRMWGVMHDEVVPDLMAIGKGIGGGLPVAAVVGSADIMMQWPAGSYTRTFLTNTVPFAAASATIGVMNDERLDEQAERKGSTLRSLLDNRLGDIKAVGDIRGLGLLQGIEFVEDRKSKRPAPDLTKRIVERLRTIGILTVTSGHYGNAIKISPPLTIEDDQLTFFVDSLEQVVRSETSA